MAPGDLVLLPATVRGTISNRAAESATILAIALRAPGGANAQTPAAAPSTATPGASIDLAGRMMTTLPAGPATLALGRATLAPGTQLAIAATGTALVAIESGRLSLAVMEGIAWSRRAADGSITTATDGSRGPGDAVLVEAGASGELRNAGDAPLVLLILTITPVSSG